jgi:CheY-like chemotaxis protein
MTGQASEADVDNALRAGARAVLWKPLSLRKVMAAVAAAVPSGAATQAA